MKPPEHTPKLAFDPEPDHRDDEKAYHHAVDIAARPLGIIQKIKDGSIEESDVRHFSQLHPELNDALQKKITDHIVKAQLKKEMPPYRTRQGMSAFMGVPLSSEMSPQFIQAAQATFMQPNQNPSSGQSTQSSEKSQKGKKSSLSKSDQSFLTGNQALVKRQQRAT